MRRIGILLMLCLLLTGCTPLLDREYRVVELHSSKYRESDSDDILRAESYQDVVNDLLLLVGEHTNRATLRLYTEESEVAVASLLERAAAEVEKDTPLGAYAVSYITTESELEHQYYEVSVRIGYRRSKEQVDTIVNATSATALEDLLYHAMEDGRKELAVRVNYWNEHDGEVVAAAIETVEDAWGLVGRQIWTPRYYPNADDVGLIEFKLEPAPPKPTKPAESEKPLEPEKPTEGETPVEGEVPPEGGQTVEGTVPVEGEHPSESEIPAGGGTTEPSGEGEPPAATDAAQNTEENPIVETKEKNEKN